MQASDFPYHRFNDYLRARLGGKTHKVSVDAGLSCPNLDGTCGHEGCAWCDNSSFNAARMINTLSVEEQLAKGMNFLRRRNKVDSFIAYFQAHSNTYANVDKLEDLYRRALSVEGIKGLAIGTRPDCITPDILDLLQEIARTHFVQIEYGLQTSNDNTLKEMGRGHSSADFVKAVEMTRARGIDICAHMITGLPGDSEEDAHNTVSLLKECGINGVKIHNLHIVKGTRLAKQYQHEPFKIYTLQEHVNLVVSLLEELPWEVNIQRLWGASATRDMHIAPDWCFDGPTVLKAILAEFTRRKTRQGSRS